MRLFCVTDHHVCWTGTLWNPPIELVAANMSNIKDYINITTINNSRNDSYRSSRSSDDDILYDYYGDNVKLLNIDIQKSRILLMLQTCLNSR